MRWPRFLGFNTLGAVLWVGVWASLSYVVGTNIGQIYQQVSRYQLYALVAGATLIVAFVVWRLFRGRRRGHHRPNRAEADP
ncbi:MAG: hypothetical protein QOE59_5302 [Actinomycetota bacterium]|jgi:membrane protein DedA with SNARE-associated domain|nr:hypothetical protein [Actinomycetota bacterium]